jgi:hypothetical protein
VSDPTPTPGRPCSDVKRHTRVVETCPPRVSSVSVRAAPRAQGSSRSRMEGLTPTRRLTERGRNRGKRRPPLVPKTRFAWGTRSPRCRSGYRPYAPGGALREFASPRTNDGAPLRVTMPRPPTRSCPHLRAAWERGVGFRRIGLSQRRPLDASSSRRRTCFASGLRHSAGTSLRSFDFFHAVPRPERMPTS